MRHMLFIYDQTGRKLLAKFSPLTSSDQTSGYRNLRYDYREGISNIAFEVQVADPKSEFILEGNWVEIWRLGEQVRRGAIRPLTLSKDAKWFIVNAFGDGIQLSDYVVPTSWEWWDKWDIADILRAMGWAMEWKTWSWKEEWDQCTLSNTQAFSFFDGDENVKSEDIILARNTNGAFFESGTIISNVMGKYGDNVEWYVFQVQDSVSEDTSIKYYIRSGTTSIPGVHWSSWAELPRSTSKTNSWSIASQKGQYIQWKAVLFTEDTETEGEEGMYGKSPIIFAARIVQRYPIQNITMVNIPSSFGIPALEFKPSGENYLDIIKKLCEKYNLRYWFNCNWSDRISRLFVSTDPGVDRSTEPGCILREGRDFKNLDVQINRNDYCNYLHLYGAGDGFDQLYDFVKDEAEIASRGCIVYGNYEDTECNSRAKLRAKGQEELDKRKKGKYALEMRVPGLRFAEKGKLPFDLFDWVYISAPTQKIDYKHQMIEMSVVETARGESIGFRLDNRKLSTDSVLNKMMNKVNKGQYEKGNSMTPNPPLNVSAKGEYKYISLHCMGNGTEFEWHSSPDGINFEHLKTVFTRYTEDRVGLGAQRWYKVRQLVNGVWSVFSGVVTATAESIPPSDIAKTMPYAPPSVTSTGHISKKSPQITEVGNKVSWTPPSPEDNIPTVIIKRTDEDGLNEIQYQSSAAGGQYIDTVNVIPGKAYRYSVRFLNDWGQASPFSEVPTAVTTPAATTSPVAPTGLTATVSLKTISLKCDLSTDLGVAGYEWRMSIASNDPEQANVIPGNGNTATYEGEYTITTKFWVRVYTSAGVYSPWSSPITVTPQYVGSVDLDQNVFRTKIFKEYAGIQTELGELDRMILSNLWYGTGTGVPMQAGASIIYQVPVNMNFNCLLYQVENGDLLDIYISNDGVQYKNISKLKVSLDGNKKRADFLYPEWVRFFKFTFTATGAFALHLLLPTSGLRADLLLRGTVDGIMLKQNSVGMNALKYSPLTDTKTVSQNFGTDWTNVYVSHEAIDGVCGLPLIKFAGMSDFEFPHPTSTISYNGRTIEFYVSNIRTNSFFLWVKVVSGTQFGTLSFQWKRDRILA